MWAEGSPCATMNCSVDAPFGELSRSGASDLSVFGAMALRPLVDLVHVIALRSLSFLAARLPSCTTASNISPAASITTCREISPFCFRKHVRIPEKNLQHHDHRFDVDPYGTYVYTDRVERVSRMRRHSERFHPITGFQEVVDMMKQQFGTRLAQSFLLHVVMLLAVSILLLMTATPLGNATALS